EPSAQPPDRIVTYKILGGDQKEYGPVTAELLREWIAQHRANRQTLVLPEGTRLWKALSTLPEFSAALAAGPTAPPTGAASPPAGARPAAAAAVAAPQKTSGLAVASLVLGILGFCSMGLTALVGFVLGLVSLRKIKKSGGRLGGRGLAIAGTWVSVLAILAVVGFGLLIFSQNRQDGPNGPRIRGNAQPLQCMNNLKQISLAAHVYASDHQQTFPPAKTWCDALQADLGGAVATKIFKCNGDTSSQRCNYGYNLKLGGLKEAEVNPQTVMFFEINGGWNVSGGPELLMNTLRHGEIINVVLADSSVRQIPLSAALQLRWNP
ncbi:MAG: DUF4190 domain-containing protein, partial [Pedosphaera sp.]|nr:DUF4190 domain-containing protein [Pedosphaera sp.]